ncbi:hypothetical protein R1sor_006742 [Riccia sorocarpa]|uniref:Uncharacterized protein n=1 Tax=Riccia sorocarpa TaxID=122646 RepID=A0ABD3HQ80_9MARC
MWGRKNVRPYSRQPLRNTPRPECATGLSPIITPLVPRYALENPGYSPGPSPGYHPVPRGSRIESPGYDSAPTPGYEPGRLIVDESPGYAPGRTGYSEGVEEKTEVSAEASSASYDSPATPAAGYSEIIGTIIVPSEQHHVESDSIVTRATPNSPEYNHSTVGYDSVKVPLTVEAVVMPLEDQTTLKWGRRVK